MDPETKALFGLLAEGQIRTDATVASLAGWVSELSNSVRETAKTVGELGKTVGELAKLNSELAKTVASLADTVEGYFSAADVRLTRIENDIEGLLRAIAREHPNGHSS